MIDNVVIHLGFLNTPYTAKAIASPMAGVRSVLAKKQSRGVTSTMTAVDVANILENKYGILDLFSKYYIDEIMQPITSSFNDTMLEVLTGEYKSTKEPILQKMRPKAREIENLFREFLNNEEMNGRVGGVPTQAALTGKGRRTRRPGPSFVDTGIYKASFRVWLDTM
jgi:hypothetical protein